MEVLKEHFQFLTQIYEPAKCIENEGYVAWKRAIGRVCLYPLK